MQLPHQFTWLVILICFFSSILRLIVDILTIAFFPSFQVILNITYYSSIRTLPLLLFAIYLYTKKVNSQKFQHILNFLSLVVIVSTMFFLTYLSLGLLNSIPLETWGYVDWAYSGAIEWAVALIIYYTVVYYKTMKPWLSATIAIFGVVVSGFIYEIPCFLHYFVDGHPASLNWPNLFFDSSYGLWINTQILAIPMLTFILHDLKWKPTKTFAIILIPYLTFSIFYFWNSTTWTYSDWIPRIPTIIFFIFILFAIPKERKIQ